MGRLLDEHLAGGDLEGQRAAVGEAFDEREQEFEDVGGLEVLGLGVGVGVVDEAVDRWEIGADQRDVEEGKIFFGLDGVPLDVAEGEARLDDPVAERGDGDVEGAAMKLGEIEAAGEEVRGLHEQGATGETGVAVEAGGDAVALGEAGGEDLRGFGLGHGCASGGGVTPASILVRGTAACDGGDGLVRPVGGCCRPATVSRRAGATPPTPSLGVTGFDTAGYGGGAALKLSQY